LGLHVEDTSAFGSIIVGISLGSTDYLRLADASNNDSSYLIELKDRSCYVLTGEARFKYRHGIGRVINNEKYKDDEFERISLTLRHVIETRRKVETQFVE
jgi:alkylated DNA repair dioxygenase AlkB